MTTALRVLALAMATLSLAAAAHGGDPVPKRVPHVTVEVLASENWDNVGDQPNTGVKAGTPNAPRKLPAVSGTLSQRKAEMVRRLFWIALAAR